MNLNAMTMADLCRLRDVLDQLVSGVVRLQVIKPASGDTVVTVDMTPGRQVTISVPFVMPDVAPEAAPVASEAAPVALQSVVAPAKPAPVAKPPRAVVAADGAPLLSGPLSEDEKSRALALSAEGHSAAWIAAQLRRRVQTVALYLNMMSRRPGAGRAAPDAGQPAPPVAEAAPAGGSVPQAPSGDVSGGASPGTAGPAAPKAGGAAPVAPTVAPPVAPFGGLAGLTGRQRDIARHLDCIAAHGWTVADDLELVHSLTTGAKLSEIALTMDRDARNLKERFHLLTQTIRDDRDRVSIDGQQDLLVVLRIRADVARGDGARTAAGAVF